MAAPILASIYLRNNVMFQGVQTTLLGSTAKEKIMMPPGLLRRWLPSWFAENGPERSLHLRPVATDRALRTLFPDQVGDIPSDLQPNLLRTLQKKTFKRLGGAKTIPIGVRLVTAINRNLKRMWSGPLFRSGLYHQLRVFPIPSDIMRTLVSWTWPGNAGELENVIERAVVLSRGPNSVLPWALRADAVELPGSGPGQGLAYA